MPKRGRPKLETPLSYTLQIRVTPAFYENIKAHADERYRTIPDYIRHVILQDMKRNA